MSSILDWHLQGVDIKVELATSGSLVAGSNTYPLPIVSGGVGGCPVGWAQWYSSPANSIVAHYNWTTASEVFSVSWAANPNYYNLRVGASTAEFPIRPGYKYECTVEARQMAGKQPSYKLAMFQFKYGTGSWPTPPGTDYGTIALADWEPLFFTSGYNSGTGVGRVVLAGGTYPNSSINQWGVQFQKVTVREVAWGDGATLPDLGWTDITCDVQRLNTRYGRETFNQRYDVGTLQVSLLNDDGTYSYHSPHPLNLSPGRQVRVTATKDGVTYPMAFGVIDTIREGYSLEGRVLSVLECVDPQTVLSNATVKSAPYGIGLTGSNFKVKTLVDQIGYPYYKIPGTNYNGWANQPIVASGRTVRDEIGVTSDSEAASFYADRDGALVYKPRGMQSDPIQGDPHITSVTADMVAAPNFTDAFPVDEIPTLPGAPIICVNQLNVDWSQARIINTVSLANAGGTAQEFADQASVMAYGPHTYQRHDFTLAEDSKLAIRADDLMTGWADPVLRVNSIAYNPGVGGQWDFALKVFLNWMLRVWYRNEMNRWGYAVCLHVQSVQHSITPTSWSIQMSVDQPVSFTELEDSLYGWDMGNWDENLWDQVAATGALWSDPQSTWSTPGDNWGE